MLALGDLQMKFLHALAAIFLLASCGGEPSSTDRPPIDLAAMQAAAIGPPYDYPDKNKERVGYVQLHRPPALGTMLGLVLARFLSKLMAALLASGRATRRNKPRSTPRWRSHLARPSCLRNFFQSERVATGFSCFIAGG